MSFKLKEDPQCHGGEKREEIQTWTHPDDVSDQQRELFLKTSRGKKQNSLSKSNKNQKMVGNTNTIRASETYSQAENSEWSHPQTIRVSKGNAPQNKAKNAKGRHGTRNQKAEIRKANNCIFLKLIEFGNQSPTLFLFPFCPFQDGSKPNPNRFLTESQSWAPGFEPSSVARGMVNWESEDMPWHGPRLPPLSPPPHDFTQVSPGFAGFKVWLS